MAELQFRWTSSLDKVFLNGEHPFTDYNCASALQGEVFSLQLAYKSDILLNPCEITLLSPLAEVASIRQVYSMPATSFGEM